MIWPFRSRKTGRVSRIDIKAPPPLPERNGAAIVAIARNEAPYMHDWLAFHALAGIREVVLYDNRSTDATAQIARSFPGLATTVIPWHLHAAIPGRGWSLHRQVLAYCHAICTFGQKFRWMAFIDIDEFMVPRIHDTIPEALDTVAGFSNISLPWTMFGHCGHVEMPEEAVPFAYDRRAREVDSRRLNFNFKCIVDPCTVTRVAVHRFLTDAMGSMTANMVGRTASWRRRHRGEFVTNEVLQLNHYYTKSMAEMEDKIRSDRVSGGDPARREMHMREYARLTESDTIEDTAAAAFLARHGILSSSALRGRFLKQA